MKNKLFSLFILFSSQLFALGYNVNFGLGIGLTESLFSNQIKENVNFLDDIYNSTDYIDTLSSITGDIVVNENIAFETGFYYKTEKLNFLLIDKKQYGDGNVNIIANKLQIPVMFKYSYPIKKTTEIINKVDFGIGIGFTSMVSKQMYSDVKTNYYGNFINPPLNVDITGKVTYSHRIGPGIAFAGVKADFSLIQTKYAINEKQLNMGNCFSVAPIIGYSFTIKEDNSISKKIEKNKRIKDIIVK